MPKKPRIYIAGPMRDIHAHNFPEFDKAAADFRKSGWFVYSPADMDRKVGVTETTDPLPPDFLRQAMKRNCAAICQSEAICLLKGWEHSEGAFTVEYPLARMIKLRVIVQEGALTPGEARAACDRAFLEANAPFWRPSSSTGGNAP